MYRAPCTVLCTFLDYNHIIKKYIKKRGYFKLCVEFSVNNYNQLNILTFQPGQFFGKYHQKYYLKPSVLRQSFGRLPGGFKKLVI